MEECDACQCNKNCTEQPTGKLMPNSIPEKPWMYILADFIVEYSWILVSKLSYVDKHSHRALIVRATGAEHSRRFLR